MLRTEDLKAELSSRLDNATVTKDMNPLSDSFLGDVLGSIESLGFLIVPADIQPSATALERLTNIIANHVTITEEEGGKVTLGSDVEVSQILFELKHEGWVIIPPAI